VDQELFAGFRVIEAALPAVAPSPAGWGEGWSHVRLACACGGDAFRIVGWPRTVSTVGGAFRRSWARVMGEVRAAMAPPESAESPFLLPLFAACDRCGEELAVLDRDLVRGRLASEHRHLPRESVRCRVCRRGLFVIGISLAWGTWKAGDTRDAGAGDGVAVDVCVDCRACHHSTRIAFCDERPSEQALRLDLLYGRR
jgi:hypothetical protein